MLLGRRNECDEIDRLLSATRAGHGGALVAVGEPGIGKTALLDHAIEGAQDFQILRSVGREAEKELPFAALHQLCAPVLANLAQLPEPQRDALRVAFGLATGPTPDTLRLALAVQSLLSGLAAERPTLCVVDDAQWLDAASERAMAFVARRSATEHILFVFGARSVPRELEGLPELALEGLGEASARALLRSVLPDRVDERVLDRILAEAHGNPLALLELPRGLTPAQLAGGFALPVSVPLTARIEASFRRRFGRLPSATRRFLLVAAAEPTGDAALVWRAADQFGVPPSASAPAEAEGLLDLTPRVVFRHPLVRSAIYSAASPEEKREAHRALAEATDPAVDPDRRAWHRAQGAARPDDDAALDLEVCAERAQSRGGFAAAAAFMERAADLTVDPTQRAARALVAAEAKRQAGALDAALRLAAMADQGPIDELQRAQVDVLRAQVSFDSDRGNEAPPLLLKAAQRLQALDARLARDTYLDALTAAMVAGRLAKGTDSRQVAKVALAAPLAPGGHRASDLLLDGLALMTTGEQASGTQLLRDALSAFRGEAASPEESLRWSWLAGCTAAMIWDYDSWDVLTARQVRAARDSGALTVLPVTLCTRAGVHLFAGELTEAASLVEQVEAVSDAIDARAVRYAAVLVAALRGREHDAHEVIQANLKDFADRGEGTAVSMALWATAALYNSLSRYQDAFAAAEQALDDPYELWYSPLATVELIEAASRSGKPAASAAALESLAGSTSTSGTDWAAAVEARSRALLSDGATAEALYREAIDRLVATPLRFDMARSHLVYGEWLRRERRHVDAREQLRVAHDLFSEFGMEGFAERARVELRATGEHPRRRTFESSEDLTPQEMRISQLVSQGATNQEVATQLFISPSTVEYHLHKVFRKLGVTSRTQLANRLLETAPPTS